MDRLTRILLGHNGAGKSTLIRYLLGFYRSPDDHPFLTNWTDVDLLDKRSLGFVPELPWLDKQLTGWDQCRLMAGLKRCRLTRRIAADLLAKVGLSGKVLRLPIKEYSKGMQQRLLLALALLGDPDILLFDEPLSGLDPFGHQQIMDLIIELKQEKSLILSTHQLSDAWQLADEIWLMQNGQFVYRGPRPATLAALESLYFEYPPPAQVLAS